MPYLSWRASLLSLMQLRQLSALALSRQAAQLTQRLARLVGQAQPRSLKGSRSMTAAGSRQACHKVAPLCCMKLDLPLGVFCSGALLKSVVE